MADRREMETGCVSLFRGLALGLGGKWRSGYFPQRRGGGEGHEGGTIQRKIPLWHGI